MQFHCLNLLDWGVSVVTTATLIASAWKCARFSKKVATLTPLSPRADIVPKKSMEKPRYKRHKTTKPREFHWPSSSIYKTLQSNISSSETSNSPQWSRNWTNISLQALISFKRFESIGKFLVRSAFKSYRELSNVHARDADRDLSYTAWTRPQDRIDRLKSLITLPASP